MLIVLRCLTRKKKKSTLSESVLDKGKSNYTELAKSLIESSTSLQKQKLREEERATSEEQRESTSSIATPVNITRVEKTRAEIKFEETQKMRLLEKAKKQALKTHKDRVADFNLRLENQSEHFDIPKVMSPITLLDIPLSTRPSALFIFANPSILYLPSLHVQVGPG
jgi:protein FAM32A